MPLVQPRWKADTNRGLAVYDAACEEVAQRCHGRCEARVEGICTGRHEHTHHVRLRAQGGSDDPENLVAACHRCHDWIHKHPKAAGELGLIDFTTAGPLSSAVLKVEKA
jgi:hypothetical protein